MVITAPCRRCRCASGMIPMENVIAQPISIMSGRCGRRGGVAARGLGHRHRPRITGHPRPQRRHPQPARYPDGIGRHLRGGRGIRRDHRGFRPGRRRSRRQSTGCRCSSPSPTARGSTTICRRVSRLRFAPGCRPGTFPTRSSRFPGFRTRGRKKLEVPVTAILAGRSESISTRVRSTITRSSTSTRGSGTTTAGERRLPFSVSGVLPWNKVHCAHRGATTTEQEIRDHVVSTRWWLRAAARCLRSTVRAAVSGLRATGGRATDRGTAGGRPAEPGVHGGSLHGGDSSLRSPTVSPRTGAAVLRQQPPGRYDYGHRLRCSPGRAPVCLPTCG